jgi:hypothetical protein
MTIQAKAGESGWPVKKEGLAAVRSATPCLRSYRSTLRKCANTADARAPPAAMRAAHGLGADRVARPAYHQCSVARRMRDRCRDTDASEDPKPCPLP